MFSHYTLKYIDNFYVKKTHSHIAYNSLIYSFVFTNNFHILYKLIDLTKLTTSGGIYSDYQEKYKYFDINTNSTTTIRQPHIVTVLAYELPLKSFILKSQFLIMFSSNVEHTVPPN